MDLIHPTTAAEVAEAVRGATAPLMVVGGRRHAARRGAVRPAAELWTTAMDRLVSYDPAEMLVVVEAGMRLGHLRATLSEAGQEWPCDEPDDATVGGVVAAGVDPVRRLRTGRMRDTVVEMQAVLGSGDVIASGARVVKSVAGFDVHRLLTGSLGTLGVITRVALKVRPTPRVRRTIVTSDGGLALADRLLDAVWAPAAVLAEPGRIVVHLEGWAAEVAQQEATVRALAACEVTDDPVVPGVGLFPDMTTVIEGGVTPSRLVEATRDLDTWRAAVGVGSVWVGWPTTARSRRAPHRLDAWVQCRSEDPAPTGHRRTPLEERVRATCDPRGILSA